MTKTIILLSVIMGEPGTAPEVKIEDSAMSIIACQHAVRTSERQDLMCATDEALTTFLGQIN